MGGVLVRKLVKHTKIFSSWAPHQPRLGQILSPQTQANVGTAGAGVLREADAAVGQKLGRFDPADRILDEMTEFLTLFVADDSPKILNLNQPLSNKDYLGHLGNPGNPGIANQLRIKRQQPLRFLWIAAGSGFPFEQTTLPVEFADCIDVGYELVVSANWQGEFYLHVATRLRNTDAVILTETFE